MSAFEQATTAAIEIAATLEQACGDTVYSLRNRAVLAGGVQHNMLKLLEAVQAISVEQGGPKAVEGLSVWGDIFGLEVKGDDISKLAQWVEAHTPIKVRFDASTGKFARVKFNNKAVNAAKDDPLADPWRLSAAAKIMWTEYKAENRKAKAAPRIDRGIDALIREIARTIDTDETYTLEQAKAYLEVELMGKLASRVIETRDSEKHEKWVADFKADQEKAARA